MARPTNADPAVTRRRLLDAATAEFARSGLKGTSLRAVAAEAGVTMPTIHYYFGNKAALYEACRTDAVDKLSSELVPLVALMASVRDQVVAGVPAEVPALVERLVRVGASAARQHRAALQLVWQPLVAGGSLDPAWTNAVFGPFLAQTTEALAGPLGRDRVSLRLQIQSVVALILRYGLSTPEHLAELAGLPDSDEIVQVIEDHLVRVSKRILEVDDA